MEGEEEESSNWEDDHDEEEVDHDNIADFVSKVDTEEISAFAEEVEGKLFDISLIDYEKEGAIEGVLPDVLRDAIVEESLEYWCKDEVSQEGERQLEVEEVKVVCKESEPILVSAQDEGVSVFFLFVKSFFQIIIELNDSSTSRKTATPQKPLK